MNKALRCAIAALGAALLVSSCIILPHSYEPFTQKQRKIGKGAYTVRVYNKNDEEAALYAVNNFVQYMSYESFDYALTDSDAKDYDEFVVTIPGPIPVKDLPKVKRWYVDVHVLDLGNLRF